MGSCIAWYWATGETFYPLTSWSSHAPFLVTFRKSGYYRNLTVSQLLHTLTHRVAKLQTNRNLTSRSSFFWSFHLHFTFNRSSFSFCLWVNRQIICTFCTCELSLICLIKSYFYFALSLSFSPASWINEDHKGGTKKTNTCMSSHDQVRS